MKKPLKILFFLLTILFVTGITYADLAARITPVKTLWSMGNIKKGEIKKKTFFIKNTGDGVLIIDKIHACCGYSVEDISIWEVEPGGKAKVMVSSDTSRKSPGKDKREITIISNDPENETLKVFVTSNILK